MDIMDRQALGKQFTRTYGGDRDGWKRVTEYRQVQKYTAEHPNQGSAAVSSAVNLPRGRIRPWIENDGCPDPVRGLQTCEDHGWLDLDWLELPFTGLNSLVAWIFSGGSIDREGFVPQFTIQSAADYDRLDAAFDAIGIGMEVLRETDPKRATEAKPSTAASALGRLLHVLGAPVGAKNPMSDVSLPTYLDEAPYPDRLTFARIYLANRKTTRPDRPNTPVQFREERSPAYRRELIAFLTDVVGSEGAIRGGGARFYG